MTKQRVRDVFQLAAVVEAYGPELEQTDHTFDPEGHYLSWVSSDSENRIIFETDGRKVTSIRAGRLPEVEYVEGCA